MPTTDPDEMLRIEVLDAFRRAPQLDDGRLDVEVRNATVTVVGTATSIAEKFTAESVANAVDGVRDVASRIIVKPPIDGWQPGDDELRERIGQLFAWDALVPEDDVVVEVTDGWVRLTGSVPVASQVAEAERAIRHLNGLCGVTNEIEIATPQVSSEWIRSLIGTAMERHAQHRARRIDLIVDGSLVILRGTIESAGQQRAIREAVRHAPGVETVIDELHRE